MAAPSLVCGDRVRMAPGQPLWFSYRSAIGTVTRVFVLPQNGSRADVTWDVAGPPEHGLPLTSLCLLSSAAALL